MDVSCLLFHGCLQWTSPSLDLCSSRSSPRLFPDSHEAEHGVKSTNLSLECEAGKVRNQEIKYFLIVISAEVSACSCYLLFAEQILCHFSLSQYEKCQVPGCFDLQCIVSAFARTVTSVHTQFSLLLFLPLLFFFRAPSDKIKA